MPNRKKNPLANPKGCKRKLSKRLTPAGIRSPTRFRDEYLQRAIDACARGATMMDLAQMFNVCRKTIHNWMVADQRFAEAIKLGGDLADERVGFALYERAVGYTYDTVKIVATEGGIQTIPYQEHVPPDVAAQKFYLTNRKPDKWKEKSTREVTGANGGPIEVANVTDLELARWIALKLNRVMQKQIEVKAEDVTDAS